MQYIDKTAVVAEIERRIDEINQLGEKASYEVGLVDAYKIILSFLDTLEVKDGVVSNDPISKDLKTAAGNYAFTQSEEDEVLKYYAFIAGAKWQKEQTIGKACEWLADNYSKYIITNGLATIFSATIDFDTIRMIEDFKKAMEE